MAPSVRIGQLQGLYLRRKKANMEDSANNPLLIGILTHDNIVRAVEQSTHLSPRDHCEFLVDLSTTNVGFVDG
jgi:hypothetical protein